MTHLRKIMLEELQRRNYAQTTIDSYIHTVEHFSRHFRCSPDQLGPQHIREYQAALLGDPTRIRTINALIAADSRAVGQSEIIVASTEIAFADDRLDEHQSTRMRPVRPSYAQALSS